MKKQRIIRIVVNAINGITAMLVVSYLEKPIDKLFSMVIIFVISMLNFYDGVESGK